MIASINSRKINPGNVGSDDGYPVELDVTLVLKRRMTIYVNDYDTYTDYDDVIEQDTTEVDTSSCDFQTAIEEQADVPDGWDIIDIEWEK